MQWMQCSMILHGYQKAANSSILQRTGSCNVLLISALKNCYEPCSTPCLMHISFIDALPHSQTVIMPTALSGILHTCRASAA